MNHRNTIILIVIIEGLLGVLGWLNYGQSIEALQAATRFSGRFSLAIFSLIFLFHNSNRFQLKNVLSEQYFLMFAVAHGIHLLELLSFVYLSGVELIPYRLAGGFLAYVLILSMPLAERSYEAGKFSFAGFTKFTWFYLFYVWFIFFMSYLPRVQGKLPNVGGSYSEFVVLLCWVSLMMGIKIQQLIMTRSNK